MKWMTSLDYDTKHTAYMAIGRPGREHQIGLALGPAYGGAGGVPPGRTRRRASAVPGGLGMRAAGGAVGMGAAKVPARAGEELRAAAETAGGTQRH